MDRHITVFVGHYGSGKTSLAVSFARMRRRMGQSVTVADLDIVNPYFRTADSRALLEAEGITLICSPYANSNLDVPALPKELYAALACAEGETILDVGGDDRGAVALGRFAPEILRAGNDTVAFVVNFYRPLTRTAEAAFAVLSEVERACGLPCTALVNNSNLGRETTDRDVLDTLGEMERLHALSGLPVWMTAAAPEQCRALEGRVENLFCVEPGGCAALLSG